MREINVLRVLSLFFIGACFLERGSTQSDKQAAASTLLPEQVIIGDGDSCSITCTGSASAADQPFLKYKEKEVYRYDIESTSFLHTPSSLKGEGTQLNYVASVDLVAENKCSFILRVSKVEITGPTGNKRTPSTLSTYPVKFLWNDGKLEKLCFDKRESESDANFKRSLISNFQIVSPKVIIESQSTYETDVYGYCPVSLEAEKEQERSWTIKKAKNLNQCTHRQGFDFAIKTGSSDSNDKKPSTNPFVDSTLKSVIRVEKDIIKSVQVNEEYNYQPLSHYADSKTRVTVSTKMVLNPKKNNRVKLETPNMEARSLIYEPVKLSGGKTNVPIIVKAVQEASKEVDGVLPESAAADLTKLIQVLQQSTKQDLLTSWSQINGGVGVQNQARALAVFWDALLSSSSPSTTEACAVLLENKQMPEDKIWEFLASLSFVKHPTDETLAAMSSLVDGPSVHTDVYLAVGSLIHKYVLDNPNKTSPNLTNLLEKLSRPVLESKARTVQEQDAVISSLKGIRNAQYMTPEVRNAVIKYAQDTQTPSRLRVAAIQTLTANSSQPEVVKTAEQILTNLDEDSEMRIQAFLLLIHSPSPKIAQVVKNVMDSEKSDQVGSYIMSYIRNLRDTDSPRKHLQKQYLANIKTKRFPYDFRQFSRNFEFSHSCPRTSLAFSGEGDVIFSRKSYVPRFVNLNLDVSLFGNTLNLFELGGRFENIEYLLNNVIGPRSYLRTTKAEQMADDLTASTRSFINQLTEKASNVDRTKRSLPEQAPVKAETVSKRATRSTKQKDTKQDTPVENKYLDIDFTMKMFESEILWKAHHLNEGSMATSQYMDSLFAKLREAVENAKKMDINYQKYLRSPLISNNVIYYPTSSGLPIKLSTNAVSIVNFKMSSKTDFVKMLQNGGNKEFNFSISPSAVLQIDGNLEIDANIMSVGLKASSSLRTATGMYINLSTLNGQGFDLKFGLPVRDQDIFTMETRAFTTYRDQGHEEETQLKPAGQRYEFVKTYDHLAHITGLSLTRHVSTPDYAHSPILGPSKFSIRINKKDDKLEFYQARFFYNNKDENIRTFELLLDTPGSKTNRQLSINAEANKAKNKYLLKYNGWGKQLAAEATGLKKKNEVGYDVKITNDDSVYNLKVGATVAEDKEKTVYKPFIEAKMPTDVRDISLDKVRVTPKTLNQQFVTVDGTVIMRKQADRPHYRNYEFQQLILTSPLGKFTLEGSATSDQDRPEYKVDIKATSGNSKSVVIQGGFEKGAGPDNETRAHVGFLSSQYPLYGFKYTYYTNEKHNLLQRDSSFAHGPDLNSEIMRLTVNEKYAWITKQNSQQSESGRATIKVKYPLMKIDGAVDLQQKNNNFYKVQSKLTMDKRTDLRFNGSLGIGNVKPGDINAQFESQMNEKRLNVNATRELLNDDQSKITITANATPDKQMSANIDVTHRMKPEDVVIKITPKITLLPSKSFYKYDLGYVNTPDEKSINFAAYPQNKRSVEIRGGYVKKPTGLDVDAVFFVVNNVDATFALQKGAEKVNGDMKINMMKTNRSVAGTIDLNVRNTPKYQNYKGVIELKWDAANDPNKKLRIDTNTSMATESTNIKSKNNVQFEDLNFETNANLQISSANADNQKMKADFNVTEKTGRSFGGKIERNLSYADTGLNYNLDLGVFYVTKKDAPPVSANYFLRAQNVNTFTTTFDITSNLSVNTPQNKNVSFDIHSTRSLDKAYWSTNTDMLLSGTLLNDKNVGFFVELGYPEVFKDAATQGTPLVSYRITSNYGDDYLINTTGKITNSSLETEVIGKALVNNARFPFQWKTETKYDFKPLESLLIRSVHNGSWGAGGYAKGAGELNVQAQNGKLRLGWESSDILKRNMELTYAYGKEKPDGLQGPFADAKFNLRIGKDVSKAEVKTEFSKDLSSRSLSVTGNTSTSGEFEIRVTGKNENGYRDWFNDFMLLVKKSKWYISNRISVSPSKPALDLLYSSPDGESKFMVEFEERTTNYWMGKTDVQWQHGGQGHVRANGEMKLDSADDVMVKLKLDSSALGVINGSVKTAENSGGKKLLFNMQKDNRPRYTGGFSYTYKNEHGKLVVEGSGAVKVNNESKPVSFRIARQILTEKQNGESGTSNTFHVNFNKKEYVLDMEGKFTDKVILLKRYLWFGETPYKMDLLYQNKLVDSVSHEKTFLAHIDLKPHIPNGESFTIDGKSTRSLSNYDSRVTFSWSPEKKIEYNLFRTPGKTGFTLTLPQRQIAGEAVYNLKLDATNGLAKLAGTLWFDKIRNENDLAMFTVGTEYKVPETENGIAVRSTAGVRLPTLPKDLSVSTGILVSPLNEKILELVTKLDMFKRKEQAVNLTYQLFREQRDDGVGLTDKIKISSPGQKWNTELTRQTMVCYDRLEYHYGLTFLDVQGKPRTVSADMDIRLGAISFKSQILEYIILNGSSELSFTKDYVQLSNDINIMGHEYRELNRITTEPKIMFLLEWKGKEVKQTAQAVITMDIEKYVNVKAQLAGKGSVATFTLFLDDEKFMKSETELFIDNADLLLDNAVRDVNSLIEESKLGVHTFMDDLNKQLTYRRRHLENASLDMKPVMNKASEYMASLRAELQKDLADAPTIQKIVSNVADFVLSTIEQLTKFFAEWMDDCNQLLKKLGEYYDYALQQLKTRAQASVGDASAWASDLMNNVQKYGKQVLAFIKEHKEKWNQAISSFSGLVKDSYVVMFDSYEKLIEEAKKFMAKASEALNSMPISSFLKERFDEMKDSDAIQWLWSTILNTTNRVRESLPTPELKTLWDMIVAFLDKIVNNKPIDTKAELKNISIQTMHGVKSILSNDMNLQSSIRDLTDNLPHFSFSSIRDLPEVWGSALQTVHSLRNLDMNSLGETLQTYSLASRNPLNLIPPFKKVGVIMNGNQVVTMNGNYLQINNDCQYVLVKDFENQTFSVIANIQNGKMASIVVSSGSETVEILPDGQQPKLNNADAEFPIYGSGVFAVRTPYTVEVHIDNSVEVECTTQLDVCLVQVSGFYYNKVHGLMGTVNADSYVDFTMPDKKLARDLPSFVKAYQTGTCKVSKTPTSGTVNPSSECGDMFNGNSALKRGFSFVKVEPFRDMCEQAVTRQTESQARIDEACKVAQTFSMVSHAYGYTVNLPSQCSKCYVEEKALPFGDTVSVKTPSKYAEIVVLLDKTKTNEQIYAEPVMNTLRSMRNKLKGKKISDIRFILIGYGPMDAAPSIHTTMGKPYLTDKTKVAFSEPSKDEPSSNLGVTVRDIKYLLGMFDGRRALEMANDYPYRADSVKAIIQVKATNDDNTSLDKFNVYNTIVNAIASWNIVRNRIPMFLVSPMDLIMSSTEGDQAQTSPFGVDINNIYTADGPKPFESGLVDQLKFLQQYKASVILPLSTQGAVFNSSMFNETDKNVRSKLSNVFADAVTRSLIADDRYSDCTCKYRSGVFSEVRCTLASTGTEKGK